MRLLKRESGKRKGFKTEVWYTPTWDQRLIPYLKSACMPGETIIFPVLLFFPQMWYQSLGFQVIACPNNPQSLRPF